jgi:hypothetical protein
MQFPIFCQTTRQPLPSAKCRHNKSKISAEAVAFAHQATGLFRLIFLLNYVPATHRIAPSPSRSVADLAAQFLLAAQHVVLALLSLLSLLSLL